MNKREFLGELKEKLKDVPQDDVSERIDFYSEIIDDRIEEGLAEEEAVTAIGSVDEIAAQIRQDVFAVGSQKIKSRRARKMKPWEIVLLAVGSPIWLSLLIAAFAIVISVYASLWSVLISLWSVFGALVGCAVGGLAASAFIIVGGKAFPGLLLLGMSLLCAGLSIFAFWGCKEASRGVLHLTRWPFMIIKNRTDGRGRRQ